jgi:hypothetical protein
MQNFIDQAKECEPADVVLLISDQPEAQRMLVAWKSLPKKILEARKNPTCLQDIWDNIEFDIEKWSANASVHTGLAKSISKMLISNNLIYPDGSLNSFVQKYLNALVVSKISKVSPKK